MRYLSLFDGIGAVHVAWAPLGWTCVGTAEIDPFPAAVVEHHYGHPNLGDVTQITDEQVAALGPTDLVVGGSPCQDLSVAGKRAGLAGARSSLFHEQLRIFHAVRAHCGARFLLWENVPGVFTTHGGRDFACVVGALAGCELPVPADGWGTEGMALGEQGFVEWAVLDAQWFGVPQRRRRVFALLDVGNWADRPPILLEPDRLRGDSAPRREAGERATLSLAARTRGGGGLGTDAELDGALIPAVAWALQERDAKGPDSDTKEGHLIPVAFDTTQLTSKANRSNPQLGAPSHPLAAGEHPPAVAFVRTTMQVRRLTPRECCRLQGFPDDYLDISYRGKPAADGPRYRALGNSMAVPVMCWIGESLDRALAYQAAQEVAA